MIKLIRRFTGNLTKGEIEFYAANGYLVFPNFIPKSDVDGLKERAFQLIDNWQPSSNHPIFTTHDQKRVADNYFMDSAYGIGFFLEENAKDPANNKRNSINKLGHAMHDLDPVFQRFSYNVRFRRILNGLGYNAPVIAQSMYIMKPPGIGAEVKIHQDNSYLITSPLSCVGLWVAIEDAKKSNACLYAVPGSHKYGCKTYWERKDGKMLYTNDYEYSKEGGVCLEVEAGTVVVLHGSLVHWSDDNLSNVSRHAYTLHCVETVNTTWSPKNWIQRPKEFPFNSWTL
ncbi:unnamed protein product [Blepharisma stoltei]|uniref:Phytanoyl-CoA dioxygenase n=1 Tax=Blepharisma stoltei TaxID=1481888 RepID=A0AAU9J4G0_9CILI|nr:unnamed protein product [Blepharisma stoltei]